MARKLSVLDQRAHLNRYALQHISVPPILRPQLQCSVLHESHRSSESTYNSAYTSNML
jgi:hypothetical protein